MSAESFPRSRAALSTIWCYKRYKQEETEVPFPFTASSQLLHEPDFLLLVVCIWLGCRQKARAELHAAAVGFGVVLTIPSLLL